MTYVCLCHKKCFSYRNLFCQKYPFLGIFYGISRKRFPWEMRISVILDTQDRHLVEPGLPRLVCKIKVFQIITDWPKGRVKKIWQIIHFLWISVFIQLGKVILLLKLRNFVIHLCWPPPPLPLSIFIKIKIYFFFLFFTIFLCIFLDYS